MKKKMSKSKVFVYVLIGVAALATLVVAAIYLPGFIQALHGG